MGPTARRVAHVCAALALTYCTQGPANHPAHTASAFVAADSLRDEGRYLQALSRYRVLRDSFAGLGDSAQRWRAQLWWTEALVRTSRYDSARRALDEDVSLAGRDSSREGWTRYLRSMLLTRLGQLDSAFAEGSRALRIAESLGDRTLETRAHTIRATIQSNRGNYRQSVPETERAVALERRFGHSPEQLAALLNNLGIEYAAVGRLGDAEKTYLEGLAIARRFTSPRVGFFLRSNLASVRAMTGDMDDALALMSESLRGAEQLPDTQGMVYAHTGLAEFYLQAGNRAAARFHLERSLALTPRAKAVDRVAALADLGRLEATESGGVGAAQTLSTALTLADASGFGGQRAAIRAELARVAADRGDLHAARRWADASMRIADSLGDPDAQLQALEAVGVAREASHRRDAVQTYLRGIDLLESWRGRLAVGDLRMGLAEPRWSVYEGAIRGLLREGRKGDAFMVAERARARLLLEIMAEHDASRVVSSPEEGVRNRLRERYEEWTAAESPAEQARLDPEISHLTDSLASIEAEAKARDPSAGTRYPVPASLSALREGLIRPGRALLAFFWGDSAVYGWLITHESERAARLGSADSIAALLDFLHDAIELTPADSLWMGPARRAYQQLVAPLAPTSSEEIFVIADGPLARIPMEVLLAAPGALPWGATQRFTYGPSASVLLALARAPPPRWDRAVLAVGNPSASRTADVASSEATVRSAGDILAPLPYAAEEARSIRDLFRAGGADLLEGRQATVQRWLALDPGRYRYLHFAAHALISDRRFDRTGLVLSGGDLDIGAIRRLHLNAALVTLSACETALGRRVRGEGVIGLPFAFLAAGARGAVVSLWRVGDRPTADFMRDFYRELHGGHSPADAMFQVRQRWIATGGADAHPSRWAPFVLVGGMTK